MHAAGCHLHWDRALSLRRGMMPNQVNTGTGGSDVEMMARYESEADGKLAAAVTLKYDSKVVHAVGVADELLASRERQALVPATTRSTGSWLQIKMGSRSTSACEADRINSKQVESAWS